MKKVAIGALWFFLIFFATSVIGGLVYRLTALSPHGNNNGLLFGAFIAKYGIFILFGSLVIAIGGTATGVLPGTQRRGRDDSRNDERV